LTSQAEEDRFAHMIDTAQKNLLCGVGPINTERSQEGVVFHISIKGYRTWLERSKVEQMVSAILPLKLRSDKKLF
jgi:hypothetical protein